MKVGIFAPSSKVPETEFSLGLERVRGAGFDAVVHPHTLNGHLFFAGTDAERAQSLWDFAMDPTIPVLWAARGGYGSARILPLLDAYAKKRRKPVPKKLLVGYSDSTALLEFVRCRWGWSTLHAPMPGLRQFCALPESEWKPLTALIRGEAVEMPWQKNNLEVIAGKLGQTIVGPLVGGNLSVWTSLVGTSYAGNARGKLVFFEDVEENLYRVDRMVQQLLGSGSLKGARAIVLGNFLGCRDLVPRVLAELPAASASAEARTKVILEPDPAQLVPLRETMEPARALAAIFGDVAGRLKIPVVSGLAVGHGPGKAPLPLGARYELTKTGDLKLVHWDWLRKSNSRK